MTVTSTVASASPPPPPAPSADEPVSEGEGLSPSDFIDSLLPLGEDIQSSGFDPLVEIDNILSDIELSSTTTTTTTTTSSLLEDLLAPSWDEESAQLLSSSPPLHSNVKRPLASSPSPVGPAAAGKCSCTCASPAPPKSKKPKIDRRQPIAVQNVDCGLSSLAVGGFFVLPPYPFFKDGKIAIYPMCGRRRLAPRAPRLILPRPASQLASCM
jgi:hypothetical protein